MPFIVVANVIYPFVTSHAVIIVLYLMGALFMDMKMSTYPLLQIDCVPRNMLGRVGAIGGVISAVTTFVGMRYGVSLAKEHLTLMYIVCTAILAVCTLIAAFGIREPPIRNPTTERFKPWSTFKVGWHDKRVIWLMVGVGTINSFVQTMYAWQVLYAKKDLGLDLVAYGHAYSWAPLLGIGLALPMGWLIDHVSGVKLVAVFWFGQLLTFIALMQLQNMAAALGVTAGALLMMIPIMTTCYGGFYGAADIMIYKSAHPKDVGSMTSTNSFMRNMYAGCLSFSSGLLIAATGTNYRAAFILGITLSTLALPTFFIYRYLKSRNA